MMNQLKQKIITNNSYINRKVLVLQRMCRWVNYMNDINILRLAESFDHNVYNIGQSGNKDNQKKQGSRMVYQRMRDNYWKTVDIMSLDEYVIRTKQKKYFGLEPCGLRKAQAHCFVWKQKKMQKNVEMLGQTLLPYSINNAQRLESITVSLPQNLQIINEQINEELC